MVKQLTVISGRDKGRIFLLPEEGSLIIGRGSSTPTRLCDLRVSRQHCQIAVSGDTALLTDCNSAVGTYVNDNKLAAAHSLLDGDIIKIGETQIKFLDADVAELETMAGHAFKEMKAAAGLSGLGKPAARDPLQELVGNTLANFRVESVLARGHSSVIFRATETPGNRAVALRVALPDFAISDAEAQRLAKCLQPVVELDHPHLVRLYAVGKTGPHCWASLELVDGENMQQVIHRVGLAGMLDWQHALRIGMHMAQALDALNSAGIVHGNITPENILISNRDTLAKLNYLIGAKTANGSGGEILAKPGDFFRDIGYMPPERAKDNTLSDIRGDIFSLGATLYTIITAHPPFQGKTPVETIAQVVQGEPLRPREYQLSLPETLERAVLKMMAKQPKDRFQTPKELLAELERIAKNPTAAPPPEAKKAAEPPPPPPPPKPPAAPPLVAPPQQATRRTNPVPPPAPSMPVVPAAPPTRGPSLANILPPEVTPTPQPVAKSPPPEPPPAATTKPSPPAAPPPSPVAKPAPPPPAPPAPPPPAPPAPVAKAPLPPPPIPAAPPAPPPPVVKTPPQPEATARVPSSSPPPAQPAAKPPPPAPAAPVAKPPALPPAPPPPPPPVAAPAPVAPPPPPAPQAERGIFVTCPCGQTLKARERYAGTRVRCPTCGTFLFLPGQAGAAPPPLAPGGSPGYGTNGRPGRSRRNPAGFVVALLAIVATIALVGSFFWSKDKTGRKKPPGKATTTATEPGEEKD